MFLIGGFIDFDFQVGSSIEHIQWPTLAIDKTHIEGGQLVGDGSSNQWRDETI